MFGVHISFLFSTKTFSHMNRFRRVAADIFIEFYFNHICNAFPRFIPASSSLSKTLPSLGFLRLHLIQQPCRRLHKKHTGADLVILGCSSGGIFLQRAQMLKQLAADDGLMLSLEAFDQAANADVVRGFDLQIADLAVSPSESRNHEHAADRAAGFAHAAHAAAEGGSEPKRGILIDAEVVCERGEDSLRTGTAGKKKVAGCLFVIHGEFSLKSKPNDPSKF